MTLRYSSCSDVWSLGVLLWEVIFDGAEPYAPMEAVQLTVKVTLGHRLQLPAACPPSLAVAIESCWRVAAERWTFGELHDQFEELLHGAAAQRTDRRGPDLGYDGEPRGSDLGYDGEPRGSAWPVS